MRKQIKWITVAFASAVLLCGAAHAAGLKSWDKTVEGEGRWRFPRNFGGAAALDTETGLLWEITPEIGVGAQSTATSLCGVRIVGGHAGFRLPTAAEFSTLLTSSPTPPDLMIVPGHPFGDVGVTPYWTSTQAFDPTGALRIMRVDFESGAVVAANPSGSSFRHWCVRGPGGN